MGYEIAAETAAAASSSVVGRVQGANEIMNTSTLGNTSPPSLTNNGEPDTGCLRKVVSAINKLRPRFVVVSGSFVHCYPPSTSSSSIPSSSSSSSSSVPISSVHEHNEHEEEHNQHKVKNIPPVDPESSSLREQQIKQFMRTMARISETIPILFVPGERDVGESRFQLWYLLCFNRHFCCVNPLL